MVYVGISVTRHPVNTQSQAVITQSDFCESNELSFSPSIPLTYKIIPKLTLLALYLDIDYSNIILKVEHLSTGSDSCLRG